MERFTRPIFLILGLLALLPACEQDLDVNAPPKDLTVVYGLLDFSDTLHYIKINKAFQTDQNANTYASQNPMPTYDNLTARVDQVDESGDTARTYILQDTLLDKTSGDLYSQGQQTVYYFRADSLDESHRYDLTILIEEGEVEEKKMTGSTELVRDFDILRPTDFGGGNRESMNFYSERKEQYQKQTLQWETAEGGARYDVRMVFHYKAFMSSGDSVNRSITRELGVKEAEDASGGDQLEMELDGEAFFQFIGDNIEASPNVLRRKFRFIDLQFSVAGQELTTYMEVNEPVSSIVQNRPEYTNLDTAAIGIFSSRFTKTASGYKLSDPSRQHLKESSHTIDLDFQ